MIPRLFPEGAIGRSCRLALILGAALFSGSASAQTHTVKISEDAPAIRFDVLSTHYQWRGDRFLVLHRTRPPALPVLRAVEVPSASSAQPPLSEAEQAELLRQMRMDSVFLSLGGTVYDGQITHLTAWGSPHRIEVWSNVDFSVFQGLGEFEYGGIRYQYTLMLGQEDTAQVNARIAQAHAAGYTDYQGPQLPSMDLFTGPGAQYLVFAESADAAFLSDPIFAHLDAIHAYYDEHREALHAAHQAREAERLQRQRELAENPPPVEDTVIYLWPGEGSRHQ